ncbi:MAG: hypothetical protein LBU66_05575 [Treponema sp.]|jgi:hypothetical protein|nr:hypothetical protein [Treponema sp.]
MIKVKAAFSGGQILGFLSVFLLIFALFLTGCFSPFKEEEMGVISINLGGGDARNPMPWPSEDEDIIGKIDYIIKVEGGGETITINAKGGSSVRQAVNAGHYTVTIDAYIRT